MSSGASWLDGMHDQLVHHSHLATKHRWIIKNRKQFQSIFGPTVQTFYKDTTIGFDFVAFDDFLQTKDEDYRKANAGELGEDVDCSMETHLKTKYGEAAAYLIESFC